MMHRLLLAVLLAVPLVAHAGPPPPDDAEMARHREKAELWAKTKSTDQVLADLRGWFGRFFEGEPNTRTGTVDIYVITYEWSNGTNRNEVVHRFRVATLPAN